MKELNKETEYVSNKSDKDGGYYFALFEKAYTFNSPRYEAYRELAAFYELAQDELSQYNNEKPWVYNINAPYATDAINLRVASLQANDYLGELEPLSPDDTDSVEKMNYAYHAMWQEMNMDKHINESILRAAVVREAYTHIIYEDVEVGGKNRKRRGRLVPYFLEPGSMHIDPKANCLKGADFLVVTERTTPKQVKRRYGDKFDLEHMKGSQYTPSQRGEFYAGTDFTTEQEFVLTKLYFYEREEDGIYKTVLVENQIVEDTKKIQIDYYPIAQLRWQKKLKSPYGVSLMDTLLPLQKTINEIESAIANTALQFSSPSYVLSEEAGINPEDLALTAGTPGAVYLVLAGVDIDKVIRPLMADRKVDDQLVQIKQEIERTIYKLGGVNDQFLGDLGTVGNTRTGTEIATQRAAIIEQRFLVNLEEYVEDLTRIIVNYIKEAFSGETMYVRHDKKSTGKFDFESLDLPEKLDDVEYTFYIKLDVKTKYSKQQQRQLINELYQSQLQYDAPIKGLTFIDVLKTYDVPQIQELVERFQHLTKMDASERAELITLLVEMSAPLGIDPQLLNAAIVELVMGLQETPHVDMIVQAIEQAKMQQEQSANQMANMQAQQMMQQQMQGGIPTGDEDYGQESGEMPTGDETY